jgi:hemerythrin superfamily protein
MKEMDLDFGEDSMPMGMEMKQESTQSPIELIKSDHRKVESLFKQFEGTEDKNMKYQIVQQICMELTVHALYEEELVYPLLKSEDEDATEEAYTEHELLKYMISEIKPLKARDKALEPKVKVLKELVEHHVEEEEKECLPELEGNEELESRAEQVMQRKQELMDREMSRSSKPSSRGKKVPARVAKKATARKTSPKKSTRGTAKKAAPAKKSVAKSMAKSKAAKSTTAKKTTAKKSSAGKASTTKKAASTRKATTRKGGSSAKRSSTKKTASKKRSR